MIGGRSLVNVGQRQAVDTILALLPDTAGVFSGSQFPAPVRTTFLGGLEIDLHDLRARLLALRDGDVKDLLEPLLLAAEVVEAAQPDQSDHFITDREAQSLVFSGAKWRAGWALVLGHRHVPEVVDELKRRSFLVFTDQPDLPDTRYIGDRPTSPIYFLQLMVRYGLVWGRIAPGDDHEMGHFLERDMPGLVFITEDLSPLKYLIGLGLMKLGAPAVVPSTFPFPYGHRVVADSVADMIERGSQFPNLRQRYFEDEVIGLPEPCNLALANEPISPVRVLGGANSFFCLRPAAQAGERYAVCGEGEADGTELGILVEVTAAGFSDDIALTVEKAALKAVSYLPGLHAYEQDGALRLALAKGVQVDERLVADAIYWGIRLQYPRLRQISVHFIHGEDAVREIGSTVRLYKIKRQAEVQAMTEENTEEFCACTECRPFSLVHTCILAPGRAPMCASRTYATVKAAAYFGSSQTPWKRQSERALPLRTVFQKGQLLDRARGEYEGCNGAYRDLTGGRLERVYLHSVRSYPHTSCGCFQALAFWIPEVEGIGIMLRNADAVAPDGQTWETLANRAGGKQSPGIVGVSLQYVHSPDFLKGDGGMANVVWVDSALHKRLAPLFAPGQKVATEKDVNSIEELMAFAER